MIDLTACNTAINDFSGSEKKFALIYNNEKYMVKFPDPIREKHNNLSYMNNQYSEYIGCEIFRTLQIPVQSTFLAKYTDKRGIEKIVVACKDFRKKDERLVEFSKFAISQVSSDNSFSTSIESVDEIIDTLPEAIIAPTKKRFWDMFVADALIGNTDRHFDNWGFIADKDDNLSLAPVYDCGSSLNSLLADDKMAVLLESKADLKSESYNIASIYSLKGKRILYHEIFKTPPAELQKAIFRIVPRIDLEKIHSIINSAEGMSNIRKSFLRQAISMRYELILKPALTKLLDNEISKQYSSTERITQRIISNVKSGISFRDIQKEADKYMEGHRQDKRAKFKAALKEACKDPNIKKIISKQQGYEL